jgi:hypothetical protein
MKAQLDKDGGRILLGNNVNGGAVMLRPIRLQRVLDFGFELDFLVFT